MHLDTLRVELRPRSPWEAVELGSALVRTHARAVWTAWCAVTLPVFVLLNVAAAAFDAVWVAWLAMWWLKPLFDRIPLFVLSRAVFGDTPGLRATLAAQLRWGWRAMIPVLGWRRFSPLRALTLPVDLLEGRSAHPRERRRVLAAGAAGTTLLLTATCLVFVGVLMASVAALGALFTPFEFLPETARAWWALARTQPPPWLQIATHAVAWAATSVIEPFYVGAGFGLYLNRRTQIEAWDVEIAFRRMRTRLQAAGAVAALLVAVGLPWTAPAQAAQDDREQTQAAQRDCTPPCGARDDAPAPTLADIFDAPAAPASDFDRAVARAYTDPLLRPKRMESQWESRKKPDSREPSLFQLPDWLKSPLETVAGGGGSLGRLVLWLLFGAALLALALTARRWWPWLQGGFVRAPVPAPVDVADAALPDVLPDDIAAAARALWREGRPRRALALLYRASVEAMALRADVALVPGATESECLRASRRMPEADDRDAFARVVRVWQYAAYAQRLPAEGDFEAMLGTLSQRFGWAR